MNDDPSLIEAIRAASRSMARDWGFMGGSFAGEGLSPSAVHALIEMDRGALSARDLARRLRLEKSSVSRMLRKLLASGDVKEEAHASDSRLKMLSLTAAGRQRVAAIHAHARAQVVDALGRLQPGQDRTVLAGLSLYSQALAAHGESAVDGSVVTVVPGYQTGLIARITQMHALYYARESGLGQRFESVVASGLAEFCNRLEHPKNGIWTAMHAGEIVGSIAIDGQDLGGNTAHLRWFIVDDRLRGSGAGRQLLSAALDFADREEFAETHLWTFSGLSAARHLYESHGFACVQEGAGEQWGKKVLEQKFVRKRP
ncbi:helix-turn-helix domain-containing GNAT family N-acetyltransferase [Acidovorax sp. Be4]|uniref:Helix-turn-helix domain-containing GNAT family N-acetyltransferase n=1 Tax=Acidovorax bellezanensis TaxID=2976702 RepID=A0ABT2PKW7_9BURK|nr:helix-turn-helix domain-containing GNAT family N-acetyltransferase [Acidovorax sp. Be4]MCT9811125.1 helix-turn-helix domain-containing GNAT family N-acetyltransferase [Acidovorax sp. Be4]